MLVNEMIIIEIIYAVEKEDFPLKIEIILKLLSFKCIEQKMML